MPEWRRTLYKLIALQGFQSQRAAQLPAAEELGKHCSATQLTGTITSLQNGQAAAHQRVVQKIQMKDPTGPDCCYVIPMASQHSFFTSHPCETTQYGRLQFDWMRGS